MVITLGKRCQMRGYIMANSGIPTLDASNLTYEFENMRVNQGTTDNNVLQYVEKYTKKNSLLTSNT